MYSASSVILGEKNISHVRTRYNIMKTLQICVQNTNRWLFNLILSCSSNTPLDWSTKLRYGTVYHVQTVDISWTTISIKHINNYQQCVQKPFWIRTLLCSCKILGGTFWVHFGLIHHSLHRNIVLMNTSLNCMCVHSTLNFHYSVYLAIV